MAAVHVTNIRGAAETIGAADLAAVANARCLAAMARRC